MNEITYVTHMNNTHNFIILLKKISGLKNAFSLAKIQMNCRYIILFRTCQSSLFRSKETIFQAEFFFN